MKKQLPPYHIVQSLLANLKDRRKLARAVFDMKNAAQHASVTSGIAALLKQTPHMERVLFGSDVPRNISDMGRCEQFYLRPKGLEPEAKWLLFQTKRKKYIISKFIETRDVVEEKILLAQYDEALELLNLFSKTCGLSIWYFEMKLLIYGCQNRTDKMLDLISEVNTQQKDIKTSYVSLLIAYLYKRSLPGLSPYDYDYDLLSKFKRNVTSFQEDRYSYLLYRLNYYQNISLEDYTPMLLMESTNSLIDRYILLVSILKTLYATKEDMREEVGNVAFSLYKITDDNSLLPFVAYTGKEVPSSYYDDKFVSILDHYYTGDYVATAKLCRDYVNSNPSCFDALKIYCRAMVFLQQGYKSITTDTESIINKIGSIIYSIMSGGNHKDNIYELYRLSKKMYGLSFCSGLDEYIKQETVGQKNYSISRMSTSHFDPYNVILLSDDKAKIAYLQSAARKIPESVVIEYQIRRLQGLTTDDNRIISYIKDVDNAHILFEKKDFVGCIDLMTNVFDSNRDCIPVAQSATDLIFKSYIEMDNRQKAVDFFVDRYFENRSYVSKIDTSKFSWKLNRTRYKDIRLSLKLLIFSFLNVSEGSDHSFIIETYCKYKNVDKVSALLETFEYENPLYVEEFLSQLVQGDILRHTKYVDSVRDILEELQKMNQYLINMKTERLPEYEAFAQELAEEMIAYEGISKDDESKIYANIPAIVKYELQDAHTLFEQFVSQYNSTQRGAVFLFFSETAGSNQSEKSEIGKLGEKIVYTDNAMAEISNVLHDRICQSFLKSKFGLGTYLSTRIRHGVFEGEVRSVFDQYHLVLTKENERYMPIRYWQQEYGLNQRTHDMLTNALRRFSEGVDSTISRFKSEVLQIRIKDDEQGYFDYRIENEKKCQDVLRSYLMCDNDFETFCYSLIRTLLEVTEARLQAIRRTIHDDLRNKFYLLLDDLLLIPNTLQNPNLSTDFHSAVNYARADIEQRLFKIERWFYIQDAKFEDFFFKDLVSVVWRITSQMHPSKTCQVNVTSMPEDLQLAGAFRVHITDVLRIFFNNMICHSQKENVRHFDVSFIVENNELLMHFENKCDENPTAVNKKFQKLLNSYERLQEEGGTGLVKARKIVKYDLGCLDNEVTAVVSDGKCFADVNINLKDISV